MSYDKIQVPAEGGKIAMLEYGHLDVPNQPIIPFIEGDGVGSEITDAMIKIINAAVEKAYGGGKKFYGWKSMPV